MKKFFAVIVAIVYLSSTVGATVHLHYCMDKLVNWSLNDEGNTCKNCGMEKDGGCCKDEQKFFKNNLDQSLIGTTQLLQAPAIGRPVLFTDVPQSGAFTLLNAYTITHAPPGDGGGDILIHNCVFRI
jgi:hypothetical protein